MLKTNQIKTVLLQQHFTTNLQLFQLFESQEQVVADHKG